MRPTTRRARGIGLTMVGMPAPGGTSLNGQVQAAVKKGELGDGNFLFGPGDVCLFAGFAAW